MDFSLSEERKMLQETIARFFESHYDKIDKHHFNANLPDGFDNKIWQESADLGIISALISPDFGGLGGTGEDISLVFELIGKSLCVEPFLSTGVLSSTALSSIKKPKTKILSEIIDGSFLVSFAHSEMNSRYEECHVETKAVSSPKGWIIDGNKSFVLNGDTSKKVIVSARISGEINDKNGIGIFLIDKDNIKTRSYNTIDGYRAAELEFKNSSGELIAKDEEALKCIIKTNAAGALALSAEALGIMQICFDTTLEYLKTRKQFGKSVGSFQAIQHRLVDMMLEIEQVKSSVMLASATFEADEKTREKHVSAAKNLVGRAGKIIAEETIQMHGGIAMTWEYSIAHYAKRLIMIDHLMGDADHHRDRFRMLSSI
ncbi:acyl-CoA/acyl-ACP dehydrogenase [Alphaproteobacteria bacterium]|jgi:alkylation response protein AidB-like acyl-CoA dehydrogenase|nr:acyl-CoA/acyl-ACP dehydrogenase [Alphaproteobacteria bacterium]MDB9871906.1 acyl-CoA/acyl-ACP dehydrogenase [Alphaproteobacteria bacterium]|tara:strand:- start:708 stop:1826 length:1119 start_codon:yes stop_codon:yes gene_type:complete